jgi:hypothetical protein
MSATEEPASTPEPPAPKWGGPIGVERRDELQGMLDAWAAEADHGARKGPFDKHPGEDFGVRLTGADVYWLAAQSAPDQSGWVPNLHLERADLSYAHLEGVRLRGTHGEVYLLHKQA